MAALINYREVKSLMENLGPQRTYRHFADALEQRKLRPEDFSIRDLAQATIKDGNEWVRMLASPKGGFRNVMEAAQAVDTSAFSSITGQIVFNKLMDGYQNPEFLWPELVDTHSSTFLNGERIAGVGGIGDAFEAIQEGQPYPNLGVAEEYIDTPKPVKRGGIVPVTKEIIIADRTGLLLERCSETGRYMGINKEKRVLDCVTGQTNTYTRNGVATNTYLTSGAYVNQQSNTLVDHTDVENAETLLAAINDPNTGEPYTSENCKLLVPLALKKTALRIVQATEVAVVDNTAGANTQRQWSPAPKPLFKGNWDVLSNAWVNRRTSSTTTWFFGDFVKAFGYVQVWDILTQQAGENSEAAFTVDTVMRFRVSEMGTPYVKNPRRVTKNT